MVHASYGWRTRTAVTLSLASMMTFGCGGASPLVEQTSTTGSPDPVTVQSPDDLVARGKYLVDIAACHDCHTPKLDLQTMELDPARLLIGRPATTPPPAEPRIPGELSSSGDLTAWWGPWGVSYAANLTPDEETGIGARYNAESFIQAMRTGVKPEGEPILPPMPWPVYGNMTDDDLRAVFAYLQTLQPVNNFVRIGETPTNP